MIRSDRLFYFDIYMYNVKRPFGKREVAFTLALDAATSAAFAWAIGSTAKAYFRNEYLGKSKLTKEELGEIFRKAFRDQKDK